MSHKKLLNNQTNAGENRNVKFDPPTTTPRGRSFVRPPVGRPAFNRELSKPPEMNGRRKSTFGANSGVPSKQAEELKKLEASKSVPYLLNQLIDNDEQKERLIIYTNLKTLCSKEKDLCKEFFEFGGPPIIRRVARCDYFPVDGDAIVELTVAVLDVDKEQATAMTEKLANVEVFAKMDPLKKAPLMKTFEKVIEVNPSKAEGLVSVAQVWATEENEGTTYLRKLYYDLLTKYAPVNKSAVVINCIGCIRIEKDQEGMGKGLKLLTEIIKENHDLMKLFIDKEGTQLALKILENNQNNLENRAKSATILLDILSNAKFSQDVSNRILAKDGNGLKVFKKAIEEEHDLCLQNCLSSLKIFLEAVKGVKQSAAKDKELVERLLKITTDMEEFEEPTKSKAAVVVYVLGQEDKGIFVQCLGSLIHPKLAMLMRAEQDPAIKGTIQNFISALNSLPQS